MNEDQRQGGWLIEDMRRVHIIDQLNARKRELGEMWMTWLMEQTRQMLQDDEDQGQYPENPPENF